MCCVCSAGIELKGGEATRYFKANKKAILAAQAKLTNS
jgi:hypothetical protein